MARLKITGWTLWCCLRNSSYNGRQLTVMAGLRTGSRSLQCGGAQYAEVPWRKTGGESIKVIGGTRCVLAFLTKIIGLVKVNDRYLATSVGPKAGYLSTLLPRFHFND